MAIRSLIAFGTVLAMVAVLIGAMFAVEASPSDTTNDANDANDGYDASFCGFAFV